MALNSEHKFFSLLTPIELEQALHNIQLNTNTLQKLKINNTSGYDLTFEIDSYLQQIEIKSIHEINFLKQFINKQINDQLKLKIKINENQYITIQLDNNINMPLQEIIEYLCKIGVNKGNELFLSPIDSNEMLMPNVKIVKLILEQPQKYSCLKLCNKPLMTVDNGYMHKKNLSIFSNNKTYLEKEGNETSYNKYNTARNTHDLLEDKFDINELVDINKKNNNFVSRQKIYNYEIKNDKDSIKSNDIKSDYYKYRQNLNQKSKSHSNLTSIDRNVPNESNFNSDIDNVTSLQSSNIGSNNEYNITNLKPKSYATFNNNNSEKYKKFGTENYKEKNNNDNKDEVNHYIKKDYDFYSQLNSKNQSELTTDIIGEREYKGKPSKNIEISVHNNNKKQHSSEKRNCIKYERNATPDYNNDLYKKYEKYSSNNNLDISNKQYELNSNYNQHHHNGANSSSISKTNNNVTAYELRNKVNSMRNQLNVYASLNSNNNENHQRERTISNNTINHNDDNNFSNYKVFKKDNDDTSDNISNINNDLSNINIEPPLNKHSLNINTNI